MVSFTKGNLNRGCLLRSISFPQKSTHIVPDQNFSKIFQVAKKSFRWKLLMNP